MDSSGLIGTGFPLIKMTGIFLPETRISPLGFTLKPGAFRKTSITLVEALNKVLPATFITVLFGS
ncbi:hypothetical protein D3C71_2049450 [compost metagenome]